MKTENVIEVTDVWKSFKTVQAVKGINLKSQKDSLLHYWDQMVPEKPLLVEMIEGIQKPD